MDNQPQNPSVPAAKTFGPDLETLNRIKAGWICGCISLGLTFIVFTFFAESMKLDASGIWIDYALMIALIIGVYRKSRTAAVGLFAYFILSKLYIWSQTGKPTGIPIAIVLGIVYFRCMLATFDYHNSMAKNGGRAGDTVAAPALAPALVNDGTSCPKCGAARNPDNKRCTICGASLAR
jgi:hypothetical protein